MRKAAVSLIVLALSALLMMCRITPVSAELVHKDYAPPAKGDRGVTSACVFQDRLFAISRGQIISFSAPGKDPEVVLALSSCPEIPAHCWPWLHLAGGEETLYLLYPFGGLLYRVEDARLVEHVRLDMADLGRVSCNYPVLLGDFLYVQLMDLETFGDYELYRFSLLDGHREAVDIPRVDFTIFSTYKNSLLLFVDSCTQDVMVYNPETRKMEGTLGHLSSPEDQGVVYDEENDQLFYLSDTRLMKYGRKPERVDRLPFQSIDAWYTGLWQGNYVALAHEALYYSPVGGAPTVKAEENVLTIWVNSSSLDTQVVNQFRLAYPDISVDIYTNEDENPLERLTTESLSKNSSIDIFLMYSYMIDSDEIFKRGFAAPIKSEKLQKNVRAMYPQITDLLTRDGKLLGYPAQLWPDFWTVNPELLEKSGLGGQPETLAEYVDMMLQWYEMYGEDSPGYTFDSRNRSVRAQQLDMLSIVLSQYIRTYATDDAPLSFDTPVFRHLLERLAQMSDRYDASDAATDDDSTYVPCIFNTKNIVSPFMRVSNPMHTGEVAVLPPVFERGEQPVLNASLEYFIVNPSSKHCDDAMLFLEFYSEHIAMDQRYMLYPGYNEVIERPSYQVHVDAYNEQISKNRANIRSIKATLDKLSDNYADDFPQDYAEYMNGIAYSEEQIAQAEAELIQEERRRYECSPEAIKEYRDVASFMSFENGARVWSITETLDAQTILCKYLDGVATLDQVIDELDRKVAMMYYEAQ